MNPSLAKKWVAVTLSIFAFVAILAQQAPQKFILETQYLLYLPDGYEGDTSKKWPLLIFLHGSGESGVDISKVKANGPPKLVEQGKKYPFIVVSPQAPPRRGWRPEILRDMLNDLKTKFRVDNDRVYLTGLSMGGFGTWNWSAKFPDEFAAIAPICGGGDERQVWKLRYMPVWCFHGAKDDVVLPRESQKMVDELKKYNSNVKFTIYPEANHNSWDVTYNNDSLYTWLLAQKKYRHQAISLPEQALREYEGVYVHNRDSLRIVWENGKLMVKPGRNSFEIKPSAENNFFWDDNSIDEIRFIRNRKKKVEGFTLMADEMEEFKKVK